MPTLSNLSATPVLPIVEIPSIPVADSLSRFPVRRIYCVGQNYAAHAREMGASRVAPFFFSKPADAVVDSGATLPFPSQTLDLHHEVELVVALGRGGEHLIARDALDCVYGWCVGLDLTRRDLQSAAKATGRPWDLAKGFDHSAPVGPLVLGLPPSQGRIELEVDAVMRQRGDLSDMVWSVAEIIAVLSTFVRLKPGDLIFTGTPEGVGPVLRGQRLSGHIDGAPSVSVRFE